MVRLGNDILTELYRFMFKIDFPYYSVLYFNCILQLLSFIRLKINKFNILISLIFMVLSIFKF